MDWLKAPATEQGRAVLAGLLSPIEQTEAYLDAIARHPYRKRIFTHTTPERARAEAVAAHDRAKAGLRRGLLDGVALSWKDNIDSACTPTEGGTRLLAGRVPAQDATTLAHASTAGLVCLGKTHLTELAFSGLGVNPMTQTPPNSLDAELAPGGSSSGAAVSVALGLAAAAIGSDTGGSIRVPAAWNGLVGFKPSTGQVDMTGVLPLCRQFDILGPIARTVEDCAEVFAVLRNEKACDLSGAQAGGLRLMVLDGLPFEQAREAPVTAFEDALRRLASAGASITHASPSCVAAAADLSPTLFAAEAYSQWRTQIEAQPELMHLPILQRFRGGRDVLAADYIAAWESLRQLRAIWRESVAGYDAVVLPTSPILPPNIDKLLNDSEYFTRENLLTLRNTRLANLLDLPAVSLPTGFPGCGIMLMGRKGFDRALLVAARAAEQALA